VGSPLRERLLADPVVVSGEWIEASSHLQGLRRTLHRSVSSGDEPAWRRLATPYWRLLLYLYPGVHFERLGAADERLAARVDTYVTSRVDWWALTWFDTNAARGYAEYRRLVSEAPARPAPGSIEHAEAIIRACRTYLAGVLRRWEPAQYGHPESSDSWLERDLAQLVLGLLSDRIGWLSRPQRKSVAMNHATLSQAIASRVAVLKGSVDWDAQDADLAAPVTATCPACGSEDASADSATSSLICPDCALYLESWIPPQALPARPEAPLASIGTDAYSLADEDLMSVTSDGESLPGDEESEDPTQGEPSGELPSMEQTLPMEEEPPGEPEPPLEQTLPMEPEPTAEPPEEPTAEPPEEPTAEPPEEPTAEPAEEPSVEPPEETQEETQEVPPEETQEEEPATPPPPVSPPPLEPATKAPASMAPPSAGLPSMGPSAAGLPPLEPPLEPSAPLELPAGAPPRVELDPGESTAEEPPEEPVPEEPVAEEPAAEEPPLPEPPIADQQAPEPPLPEPPIADQQAPEPPLPEPPIADQQAHEPPLPEPEQESNIHVDQVFDDDWDEEPVEDAKPGILGKLFRKRDK